MNVSNDQSDIDTEEKRIIIDFIQTECDASLSKEVGPKHNLSTTDGYFSTLKYLLRQLGNRSTHYASLQFDDTDDVSSLRNDTLHDNNAHIHYLSSYTLTLSREDSSRKRTKHFHSRDDPIYIYPKIPHPH